MTVSSILTTGFDQPSRKTGRRTMSKQEVTDETGVMFEKDITMILYSDKGSYKDPREWIAEVLGDEFNNIVTESNINWHVNIGDETWGYSTRIPSTYVRRDDVPLEEIKESLGRSSIDGITLKKNINKSQKQEKSMIDIRKKLLNMASSTLPDELPEGAEWEDKFLWYQDERDVTKVRFSNSDVGNNGTALQERRVLAKQTVREEEKLYETISEVPSFAMKIDMQADEEDTLSEYTKLVITRLHKFFENIDHVGKVRYTACNRKVSKEGECYGFN